MYVVARGGGVRLGIFLSHCYSNRWAMPKDIQWIGSASCCVFKGFLERDCGKLQAGLNSSKGVLFNDCPLSCAYVSGTCPILTLIAGV